MECQTIHLRDLTPQESLAQFDVAVVIDVIRAFTVAPWILAQGAATLLLAPNADVAVTSKADRYPHALLLKDGPPDPRFDLPNAPGRIAQEDLHGDTVIQTTGNGTRGAHAVAAIPTVLCASFVTAAATAEVVGLHKKALLLTTEGDEDTALAEYLQALVSGFTPDPTPYLRRVAASNAGAECAQRGKDPGYPGFHVDDLDRCLELDKFNYALRLHRDGDLLAVTALAYASGV
ncbi:MAG: 2-phosphosulfolactate phosphatase [Actinomycetia bacterium]|nr:2-phosphosulfolactate phosphatase [Actinomycetes bacterium]